MLSRQANSLYWIGRYEERVGYLARFFQVKYFSTMDSPMIDYREQALKSIQFTAAGKFLNSEEIDEGEILWDVTLNSDSTTSIISYVTAIRENTKGIRNIVSNELWENVNKNYHFVNNYSSDYLKSRGLYEFTHGVQEHAAAFYAKVDNTLLHDDVWAFIKLGMYVERAYQITRILINTIADVNSAKIENDNPAFENYQWLTTLNVLEATDMTRKLFKQSIQQSNTCEFLITNLDYPRSIAFCLSQANKLIRKIKHVSDIQHLERSSVEFKISKLSADTKYLNYKFIDHKLYDYLNSGLAQLVILNNLIHEEFFNI